MTRSITSPGTVPFERPIPSSEMRELLATAGLKQTAAKTLRVSDGIENPSSPIALDSALPPPAPPSVRLNAQHLAGAETFSQNLDLALSRYLENSDGTLGVEDLNASSLLTAFLMLNVDDPNNSPETQNMLHQIASSMRQLGIEEAQKRSENAQESRLEAEKYAQTAAVMSTALTVVSIAASVFTVGAGILTALAALKATAGKVTASAAVKIVATESGNFALRSAASMAAAHLTGLVVDKASDGEADPALKAALQAASSIGAGYASPQVFTTQIQQTTNAVVERARELAQAGKNQAQIIDQVQAELGSQLDPATFTDPNGFIANVIQARGIGTSAKLTLALNAEIKRYLDAGLSKDEIMQLSQEHSDALVDDALDAYQQTDPDVSEEAIEQLRSKIRGETERTIRGLLSTQPDPTLQAWSRGLKQTGLSLSLAANWTEAGAELEQARKETKTQGLRLDAKRFEFLADQHQDAIDETGALMQELVESKNSVVDAVMSMRERSFVAQQKLMAAYRVFSG